MISGELLFGAGWGATECQEPGAANAGFGRDARQEAFRGEPGLFEDERVVQKEKGLRRHNAGGTLAGNDTGIRKIEELENLRQRVAKSGHVNAPAIFLVYISKVCGGSG